MPYCRNCGSELDESSKFCGSCGVAVNRKGHVISYNDSVSVNCASKIEETKTKHRTNRIWIAVIFILSIALISASVLLAVFLLKGRGGKKRTDETTVISSASESTYKSDSHPSEITESKKAPNPSSIEMIIDEDDGTKELHITGKYVFTYDGDRLIKVSLYNNGIFAEELIIEYDDKGNPIIDYDVCWDSDGFGFYTSRLTYDENNNIIMSVSEDGMYTEKYKNDVHGNHIHTDYYITEDGNTELNGSEDSTYDELNRCIFSRTTNNEGEITEECTYKYNGTNTRPDSLEIIANDDESGRTVSYISYSYRFDSEGVIIEEVERITVLNGKASSTTVKKYNYDTSDSGSENRNSSYKFEFNRVVKFI